MYFLWDFRYCGKPPREITRFEEVAPPRRSGRSRRRPPPEALPPPGSAAFSPGLCRPHPLGAGGRWRIPDPPRAGRSSRVRRRPATPVRCSADSGRWRSPQPESPRSPGTPGLLPRCRLSGRNRRRKPPVPFDDTVFCQAGTDFDRCQWKFSHHEYSIKKSQCGFMHSIRDRT